MYVIEREVGPSPQKRTENSSVIYFEYRGAKGDHDSKTPPHLSNSTILPLGVPDHWSSFDHVYDGRDEIPSEIHTSYPVGHIG